MSVPAPSAQSLVRVCAVADVPPGEMRRFELPGHDPILLCHLEDGIHATADTCTHAEASLSEGDLDGDELVCAVHFGAFHVPTGKALCFPVTEDLRTYPVQVRGDDVYVGLSGDRP